MKKKQITIAPIDQIKVYYQKAVLRTICDHVAKQLRMRKLRKYPAIESDRRVLAPNKGTLAAQHSRLGGDA